MEMENTRNLLRDVLGVEKLPNSIGFQDAETGIRYLIPSDTQDAAAFRKLLTEQEREAFAKENHSFATLYDAEKNLKSVQKGPMWGKSQYATPNKTTTNLPTTATN
ncbi:hypothetical protein BGZ88_003489 [Linnemannia elongata]|nr:hypothetical protein BGZ88_003489 [Linnemannia elongata]